jgi:hypothetical protein
MVSRANPHLERMVDQGRDAIAGYELQVAPLITVDFDAAFAAVGRPETSAQDLALFHRWREAGG